jgi:hypothetical protein
MHQPDEVRRRPKVIRTRHFVCGGSDTRSLNTVALQKKVAVKFFPQFSSGTWRQVQNYRSVVYLSFDSERWLG